jgi:hypothetical protein
MRHYVPVLGGFDASGFGSRAQVAADPTIPGRYAIGVLSPARTNLLVLVTNDSGASWSGPVTVPDPALGVNFKQWMAYGPTGVLGLIWKEQRDDLPGPPESAALERWTTPVRAFDVYTAVSCDGGTTWYPVVRVNAQTSPVGVQGVDDLSYLALDAKYVHLVWGDRRLQPTVKLTGQDAFAGVQSWYGRVPFSLITHGASCGKK